MLKITEKHGKDSDDYATYDITVEKDGKEIDGFSVQALCDCPEDASLERDLNYAYSAIDFFKLGYEAGKNNEEVIFESIND